MSGERGVGFRVRGRGRLTPEAIREIRFRETAGFSRGVSADDVRHFVDQVSDDMASLYDELAQVYAENHRIKTALRDWQSKHGVQCLPGSRVSVTPSGEQVPMGLGEEIPQNRWKPRVPKPGEVVKLTAAASVQFGADRGVLFRIIRVSPQVTYAGWIWLIGYTLDQTGRAIERREVFVQILGLIFMSARKPKSAGPTVG